MDSRKELWYYGLRIFAWHQFCTATIAIFIDPVKEFLGLCAGNTDAATKSSAGGGCEAYN